HDTPGDVPGLQGGARRPETRFEFFQEQWSPAARFIAMFGGGALAGWGLSRRGLLGPFIGMGRVVLVARGLTNSPLRRLIGVGAGGLVRFERNPDGSTRVDVKMSYNPPAGAIGHAVAALFGSDPKQAMDDDLVRFKSLLEHGKTTAHGEEIRREELSTPEAPP